MMGTYIGIGLAAFALGIIFAILVMTGFTQAEEKRKARLRRKPIFEIPVRLSRIRVEQIGYQAAMREEVRRIVKSN